MALNVLLLRVLQQLRPHLPADASLCCLGYPDVLVSEEQVTTMLGAEFAGRLQYRPDSQQIIAWHHLDGKIDRVIDAESLFAALGLKFTAIDIVASRGIERIVDLNEPAPPDLIGAFDIVLDAGTMEHCFNVGQTVRNIVQMAKVGGFTIHLNPMGMINHGFFNFSPTFYHDFYTQNGHVVQGSMQASWTNGLDVQIEDLHPVRRQNLQRANAMILCVARKKHDRPLVWPMQSKYLDNPELKL